MGAVRDLVMARQDIDSHEHGRISAPITLLEFEKLCVRSH
jgi:hypothetical protein